MAWRILSQRAVGTRLSGRDRHLLRPPIDLMHQMPTAASASTRRSSDYVAEFGAELSQCPTKDIDDKFVPEASMTVNVGSASGTYDLAALIYHVSGSHFVSQFLYKGRAFYHDGMDRDGHPRLVGDTIDVQYGFRNNSKCTLSRAVYVLRGE